MDMKQIDNVLKILTIKNLRYNPIPPPIKGGREFSKGPIEAFLKIEDVLSLFADGKIPLDTAKKALLYARNAILPKQRYKKEILDKLIKIYDEAIDTLDKLRSPDKVKKWLLEHGQPRKKIRKLNEFF